MSCRKRRRWHFRDPKFKNFLGEHAPRTPPGLGRLRRANFSPAWTFKISRYPIDYRYLVAYEIIAQGWKKRLGLEGGWRWGGGGGGILKIIIFFLGGGVQFSSVMIFGGLSFNTPHFSDPSPPAPWDVINDRSLMSSVSGTRIKCPI